MDMVTGCRNPSPCLLIACIPVIRRRSASDGSNSNDGDEEESSAFVGKTLEDLQKVSEYFPDVMDNSTEYFLTTKEYDSPIQAMVGELGISLERATNLHFIGASYLWSDKFRRTHHPFVNGPVPAKTCFRVYIYPRLVRHID